MTNRTFDKWKLNQFMVKSLCCLENKFKNHQKSLVICIEEN
jgi:hypothetical protein